MVKTLAEVNREEKQQIAMELEKTMSCNCDLDKWQPEPSTGHSWVCRIHTFAISEWRRRRGLGT